MKTRILTAIIIVGGLLPYTNGLLACTRPVAILYGSPDKTFVGNQVYLDGSHSYSTDGRIAHYKWNFDYGRYPDSNWVEGANIIPHIYQTPGHYIVALKVVSVWNVESLITTQCQFTVDVKGVIYVNGASPAGEDGNGFTWASAFNNPQSALDDANSGVQIWVAQGTYVPSKCTSSGNSRTATFQLANGVRLYGGFNGTETSLDQRDWQAYPTVLSGDLGTLGDIADNCYHVVTGSGTNATAVLDGFAITAGNANGTAPCDSGGGMYNSSGSPTVNNCGFSYNKAITNGGGVYNSGGEPNFTNCTFGYNYASCGGGAYNNGGEPNFTNCTFINEDSGEGVYNSGGKGTFAGCVFSDHTTYVAVHNAGGASPLIKNCVFTNNSTYSGSAIYNDSNNAPYSPQITNCIFAGNSAFNGGGAIYLSTNCHATITNCVFNNNSAQEDSGNGGGAIKNEGGEPNLNNCILWGNNAYTGGEIANYSGTIRVSYCDIEGGLGGSKVAGDIDDGGGNINADPRFADANNPAGLDGIFFTDDDGLQLEPNSPCIDTCPASGAPDKDILGQTRVNIPFIGSDTAIIVDMGAYEVPRPVWHVKQNSTGSNNGIGWNNAFGYIQDALAAARTYGGDIWVAAGTYKPDEDNNHQTPGTGYRDANFALINGVGIYGGFDGNETMCSRRNPARNETILSGNIDEGGDNDSNHVVTARDVNNTALLAGFTIADGNAGVGSYYGGGLYDYNASPTITDCNFKNNRAQRGGAIYNVFSSNPTITHCFFINNEANGVSDASGGAISDYNTSSPTISNCIFTNNRTRYRGGAVDNNDQSSPTIISCVFSDNNATNTTSFSSRGGAVCDSNKSSPIITNCVFTANTARNGGGIYNSTDSSPTMINCTFSKNSATKLVSGGYGGAIYNASSNPMVTNSILWGNTAYYSSYSVIYNTSATPTFKNCDIKGCMPGGSWNTSFGTNGGGNIDVDPNFADANNPAGPDGIFGTSDDGLQLQIFDPNLTSCVDAADGNAAPATDLRGHRRIDLEFVHNTGSGDPNYADMGAYEYDDTPGYTTSFEKDQGYDMPVGSSIDNGVDGWKVEKGSHTLSETTYIDPNNTSNSYKYQYDQVSGDSKISYETTQPRNESTVRISCIPSPGSYINVMNGPATIASIKFGGDDKIYVWDNGAYKVSSVSNYTTIANTCRDYLNNSNGPSYEDTWIEFTIKFNWVNHSYDVSWRYNTDQGDAVIYLGAKFYSGYSSYTKVEFITGTNSFELNRMSFSDAALEGGVIAPDKDIWLIAPQANLKDPLKGRCAIVGPMWYDKLGQYIISACPSDLDINDANSWMRVCSGRTVSKYATTLGYWNTASFYNGDYLLKVEVYDDIGRLHTEKIITMERRFNNGQMRICNATYPIIGRFKPQTFTYQEMPDFKINWPGSFPFEFQRMYNSGQSSRLYPLFFGWTHNHNIRLIEDASFDWIKDASEKPVGDNKKLGIGKLWLCLPSGGGLFIGHVDDSNRNNVIYEPTDKTNQRIVRTVNSISNPTTTPHINVIYVYYAPDGRKMTFNKEFDVNYPVPTNNEGLIGWMAVKGVDKQEDRFGNALEYTWDTSETCLQQISNNRTPANLRFTYGTELMMYNPYLCGDIMLYNGNDPCEAHVYFRCGFPFIPGYNHIYHYSSSRVTAGSGDYTGDHSRYQYESIENPVMIKVMPNQAADHDVYHEKLYIDIKYNDDRALIEKQYSILPHADNENAFGPYRPIERYNYEYDDAGNLTTIVEVNIDRNDSLSSLRKEVIVTSPSGALLSSKTRTFSVSNNGQRFEPYAYSDLGTPGLWPSSWMSKIEAFGFHAGGGGATDVNYYYEDSRFPFKPTKIVTYFSDDGNGGYNKPSQKTTLAYDSRGNVTEQKVYLDDVNYTLTTFAYHNDYDFPTRKTTWQAYRHDGDSQDLYTKVEQQWLYGDVNGTLVEGGSGGNYLAVQKTLLDNSTVPEEWADVCCMYYSGGQIKRKTDPEGGVSYYQYDIYGFECNEWQGAAFAGGSPVGNPQKRYYYDGLGRKILDADYLGKVEMNIYDSLGRVIQAREYIDPTAVSRTDFEPNSYDSDISTDGFNPDYSVDSWNTRTIYDYFVCDKVQQTILPTAGGYGGKFIRNGNGVSRLEYYVDRTGNYYYFASDDGRTMYESRSETSPWVEQDNWLCVSMEIVNIYDSMRRLTHKYSYFGLRIIPETPYYHKYIKHEEYQYDASGNKIAETVYNVERKQDDDSGQVRFESKLEKQNSFEYDILNRLTKEIVDSNTAVGMKLTTKYGYDAVGNRIYVVAPDGNVILTDYDNTNRKVCDYFATTPVYITGTDKVNITATRNNTGARKEVTYYKNDKVKDVNSYDYGTALLARSRYFYDSRGRIETVIEDINNTQNATTSYDYNDVGFNLPGGDPCGYKYQIKITDANGKNTWISMYPLGKPQKIVYPSNDYEEYIYYNKPLSETEFYDGHNPNGLLEYKAVWDANGDKKYINYEYDDFGKVKKITYPDGGYMEYKYTLRTNDDFGRPKQIRDYRDANDRPGELGSSIYIDYWYPTGQVRSYTDYDGYTVNYDYSCAYDQPTNIEVNAPNGGGVIYEVNYVYDMAGRLKDVCEPLLGDNCLIAGFDYDKNGNRKQLDYYHEGTKTGSTTSIGYSYNRDNMLTGFATSGGPAFSFDASGAGDIDGLGRLRGASETITNTSQTQIQHDYTNVYDMRSELTSSLRDSYLDTYSYDKAGNVTSHTSASALTSYGFTGDLMTSASSSNGGDNFASTWNKNGDLNSVSAPAKSLVYNWDNKLRSATNGPNSISLKYDPMGNRVYKSSSAQGTRKYVVDIAGGLPTILLEIDPCTSSLKKTYIWANGEILAQHNGSYAADRYFYLHDRLGNVREVIDQNTTVVRQYTYDPFGKTREGAQNNSIFPFMFTGQYYDYEIGQYYLRARQYDPQLMRFTARDPVDGDYEEPMTLHKYLYCQNNSLNWTDPSGRLALAATDKIIVAAVVYVVVVDIMIQGLYHGNDRLFDFGLAVGNEFFKNFNNNVATIAKMFRGGSQNVRDNFGRLKEIGEKFGKTLKQVREAIEKAKQKSPYNQKGRDLTEDEIEEILQE